MNRNTQAWVGWAIAGLAPIALFLAVFDLGQAAPPLRVFLGWGAFLVPAALFTGGLALVEADRRHWRLRWQAVAWAELFVLCLLGLSHMAAAAGLADALLGRRGGLAGWGVSQLLDVFLPPVLVWVALILLTLGAAFGLLISLPPAWLDGLRARLPAWAGEEWQSLMPRPASVGQHLVGSIRGAAGSACSFGQKFLRRLRGTIASPSPEPDSAPSAGAAAPPRRSKAAVPEEPAPAKDLSRRRRPRNARLIKRPDWLPPMDLLRADAPNGSPHGSVAYSADARQRAQLIKQTLADFGVPVEIVSIKEGPTVTQFGVEPGEHVKERDGQLIRRRVSVQSILRLRDDLALELAAASLRIEAPVPGRPYVGIEVPNTAKVLVSLRNILESDAFLSVRSPLTVALGRDVSGDPVVADLARMPHLLIAGATGSGKSVCINAIVTSLLMSNGPEAVRFVMVDPKMVELPGYNGIPHLLGPVITDPAQAAGALSWLMLQMDDRYRLFSDAGVRNIFEYNRKAQRSHSRHPLPYLVLVIDELADLMMTAAVDVERQLCRLGQMARATGIHLVLATQRPSVDVITGLIKANFPARIAFAVTTQIDSRVILDTPGAEKLLGRGDMLFMAPDSSKLARIQGCYVSDREIEHIVNFWTTRPETEPMPAVAPWAGFTPGDGEDQLLDQALKLLATRTRASTSLLQRQLRIGFPRAARLMDQLEDMGAVAPDEGGGRSREVLYEPPVPTDDDILE